MTTYTYTGFTAQFNDDDTVTNVSEATISVTVADSQTFFSYQVDGSFPDSLDEVSITTPIIAIRLERPGEPAIILAPNDFEDVEFNVGQVVHSGGTSQIFGISVELGGQSLQDFVFQLGGAPLPTITNEAQFDAFLAGIVSVGGVPSGPFSAGQAIPFTAPPSAVVSQNDTIIGTVGNDDLEGGLGDDLIIPGPNFGFDLIDPGVGNDTVDFTDSERGSFYEVDLGGLTNPITLDVDLAANTGTINAGSEGTDTLIDPARGANFDTGDGLGFVLGDTDDTVTVTTIPDHYVGIASGAGNDSFDFNIGSGSTVRIQLNFSGDGGPTQAADVDIGAGVINNDGYGDTDTVTVMGDGRIEVQLTDFADTYVGWDGRDRVIGQGGDDTLDGAGGWDTVRYDRRQVDSVVVDLENGTATGNWNGTPFTHTLSNFEEVRGTRGGNDMLIGNDQDNALIGREGDDTMFGNGGNDSLYGDLGNDTYVIDGRNPTDVTEIFDYFGVNTLRILNFPGFDGGDFYVAGSDLVRVSNQGQTTIINDGVNTFETVEWTTTDQTATLNTLDLITDMNDATRSNYTFVGTQGSETVVAPTFFSDTGWAEVYLNDGDDQFFAGTGYTAYVNLGSGNDTFSGSSADDWARGQDGDDFIDGLDGNDTMFGEDGNDTLTGGVGDDEIHAGGGGTDVIIGGIGIDHVTYADATGRVLVDLQSDVSGAGFARFFTEGAGLDSGDTFTEIENVSGGLAADNLRGDGADNALMGNEVSDRLYGRAGDDTLDGGTGADAIYGNSGADVMTGGPDAGRADRFIYFQASETGVGAGNRDVITDFVSGEDRIEIRRIDADITQGRKQGFDFIGDTGFSGTAGELRYEQIGGNTIVQADRDGDGLADMEIELTGIMDLTADDFFI